ncbi:hypothetical protein F475_01049 [Pseudomonas sp. URMO17WK12:I6]|nr:hypothetical protein F475_01049 [Pseudomonas sp. URMO17WK12:I6]
MTPAVHPTHSRFSLRTVTGDLIAKLGFQETSKPLHAR